MAHASRDTQYTHTRIIKYLNTYTHAHTLVAHRHTYHMIPHTHIVIIIIMLRSVTWHTHTHHVILNTHEHHAIPNTHTHTHTHIMQCLARHTFWNERMHDCRFAGREVCRRLYVVSSIHQLWLLVKLTSQTDQLAKSRAWNTCPSCYTRAWSSRPCTWRAVDSRALSKGCDSICRGRGTREALLPV